MKLVYNNIEVSIQKIKETKSVMIFYYHTKLQQSFSIRINIELFNNVDLLSKISDTFRTEITKIFPDNKINFDEVTSQTLQIITNLQIFTLQSFM